MRIVPGFPIPTSLQTPQLPGPKHKPAKKSETLTIATVNDDFSDKKSRLKQLNKVTDVMLVQEAKRTNIRKLMGDKSGVHQDRSSEDRAGSAVVWDRKDARATKRGFALASAKGEGILNRWVTWVDLKVGDKKVRMVSVHRPPGYASKLWPQFDANLRKFIKMTKEQKMPLVIGMDANTEKYGRFARAAGMKWHAPKHGTHGDKVIDGFLASPGVKFDNIHRLKRGPSDHNPVVADITLR
jgi:endonuclease/exonuclease/phosphatase family metal-dependent hydrolase